jgi:hypothetical protein
VLANSREERRHVNDIENQSQAEFLKNFSLGILEPIGLRQVLLCLRLRLFVALEELALLLLRPEALQVASGRTLGEVAALPDGHTGRSSMARQSV